MKVVINFILGAALAGITSASYKGNLNYQSPSFNHPELGISIRKVVKRADPSSPFNPSQLNFTHGVASGDPYPDSVILWTRISPSQDNDRSNITVSGTAQLYSHETNSFVSVSKSPVCVDWKISTLTNFTSVASSGRAFTSSDIDYTVKVEAGKLTAFTTYYYQFTVCNSTNSSPIGRTKTTPYPNDKLSRPIKLAVYSCSNYPFGFFNAYGNPVRKDSVDYVLHLGDYIYEYGNGEYGWGNSIGRIPQPDRQIFTLYDYRRRIATYRTDLDLVASHQQFAWIPVWDDHEVADNTYRDGSSEMNNTESSFVADGGVSFDARKANAVRAYFEWMPLRQVEMDDNLRIWRSFQIGTLFDLVMLDTRHYDRSVTDLYWNTDYVHAISNDTNRSLMGSRQENWFHTQLIQSKQRGAAWRIIGSQIVFSRLNESLALGDKNPLDYDAWDGYLANKNRTLNTLYANNIGNNIMLSGDSHASWVSDLAWLDARSYDPSTGSGAIGVEFAGSAVTSPCPAGANISLAAANTGSQWLVGANSELQWQDLYYRDYFELSISYEKVHADFFGIPEPRVRSGKEIKLASFDVVSGENKLSRSNGGVGGGVAQSGYLKGGKIIASNQTIST